MKNLTFCEQRNVVVGVILVTKRDETKVKVPSNIKGGQADLTQNCTIIFYDENLNLHAQRHSYFWNLRKSILSRNGECFAPYCVCALCDCVRASCRVVCPLCLCHICAAHCLDVLHVLYQNCLSCRIVHASLHI